MPKNQDIATTSNLPAEVIIDATFTQEDVQRKIYTIRGVQVMLDSDLAMFYGIETKALNQAVRRNQDRFPEDFVFQLTREEAEFLRSQNATLDNDFSRSQNVTLDDENLRSQNVTSNSSRFQNGTLNELNSSRSQNVTLNKGKRGSNIKYLPYAFTEEGVSQLASCLKSDIAAQVSVRIIRAFVAMRRFLLQNANILQRLDTVERHQLKADDKIEAILQRMDELAPAPTTEQIFNNGCVFDAWQFVSDLIRKAQERIILVDNYVDETVLSLLDKRAEGVTCTIHTRFTEQFTEDLKRHNEQYPEIRFQQLPQRKHDRWLIIDSTTWMLGTSIKDMGRYLCAVKQMELTPEALLQMVTSSQH